MQFEVLHAPLRRDDEYDLLSPINAPHSRR